FSYAYEGDNWNLLKKPISIAHLSDEGNGFTGNFVGICVQDLQGTKLHADFDYFHYRPINNNLEGDMK
ncbi:beta-xylosidase family glycoside hydrolase, partial [Metabacillus niabensis]